MAGGGALVPEGSQAGPAVVLSGAPKAATASLLAVPTRTDKPCSCCPPVPSQHLPTDSLKIPAPLGSSTRQAGLGGPPRHVPQQRPPNTSSQ